MKSPDMFDWLLWFTRMENSKVFALVLFFTTFCGILIYVFTDKQRSKRLESYRFIPFQDEPAETDSHSRKVMDNERDNN
jgi:cbb3-type cytochrome oxidase subunit 3